VITFVIDTNVIVRYLTQAPPDLYERARELMEKVSAGGARLSLSAAVLGEVAAILHHVYGRPRSEVAVALLAFATARGVEVDEGPIVLRALERSRDLKDIDFIDAYVAEKAADAGRPVASFDKALHKKLGTTVFAF
jgi:predicted nucleic acid-binding protein